MDDSERLIWGKYLRAVATSRRMELEALDELLNEIGKPILEAKTPEYNLKKIKTIPAEGPNGIYQKASQADNQNNSDFDLLIKDLDAHDGKLIKDGLFIWRFNTDKKIVGLKPSKR